MCRAADCEKVFPHNENWREDMGVDPLRLPTRTHILTLHLSPQMGARCWACPIGLRASPTIHSRPAPLSEGFLFVFRSADTIFSCTTDIQS